MRDVTMTFEFRLVAAGRCAGEDDIYGVAWESETGFEWTRVAETEPGTELSGVSTDGGHSAILVGIGGDGFIPLAWAPDGAGGFESSELPTDADWTLVHRVAWGDDSFLAVGAEYLKGPEGRPKAAAWLKEDAGWQLLEVPPDAAEFGDVIADVDLYGSAYLVVGTTIDGTPALWRWDASGWGSTVMLPGGDQDEVPELIDLHTVLGTRSIWLESGDGWDVHVVDEESELLAAVRLEDGLLAVGLLQPDGVTSTMVVMTSADGIEWRRQPGTPEYRRTWVFALESFGTRTVGVGHAVFVGPGTLADYQP